MNNPRRINKHASQAGIDDARHSDNLTSETV